MPKYERMCVFANGLKVWRAFLLTVYKFDGNKSQFSKFEGQNNKSIKILWAKLKCLY